MTTLKEQREKVCGECLKAPAMPNREVCPDCLHYVIAYQLGRREHRPDRVYRRKSGPHAQATS